MDTRGGQGGQRSRKCGGPIIQRGLNVTQLTKSVKRTPSRILYATHPRSRSRKPILKPNTNLEAELGEVSTRTCLCEEELKRDTHQEVPQLHQSKHVATSATSAPTPDEDLQRTSASLARLDRLEEQVANLLRPVDIHQNKPELSQSAPLEAEKTQPSDTSGKEKSNITHTKHRLNPQDGTEDRADDKSGPKGNAGAHDRQSQVEEHEHEPRAT